MENNSKKKTTKVVVAGALLVTALAACDTKPNEGNEMRMLERRVRRHPYILEQVDKDKDGVPQRSEIVEFVDIDGDRKLSKTEIGKATAYIDEVEGDARKAARVKKIDALINSIYIEKGYAATPEDGISGEAYSEYLGKKLTKRDVTRLTDLIKKDVNNWIRSHDQGTEK
ncbi:MAG: hypothetical protein LBQ05_02605 [Christensenellaceae bacterium]|jgi:hemolysin activation/secretion protein|nr:hypothetical protein [Christensenellaceae bacterium]